MKELTLEITNRCSLNCIQCSSEADSEGEIFFKLDKIEKILEKYNEFDTIRLSGGEPFEHPKIDKICELIKNLNKKVVILSSGVFYDAPLPKGFLKKIGCHIDEIVFSYHGREKIHEEIVTQTDEY